MKRGVVSGLFAALVVLVLATPTLAQNYVFYVRLDHSGCEDGSEKCPFNTIAEAKETASMVCKGHTFEIHKWNEDTSTYEYFDTFSGAKPFVPGGVPIAQVVQILLIALVGAVLLIIALRLRRSKAG